MLFSSMIFLWGFLPIVVLGGCLLKGRKCNLFLLVASLLFYAWGEPVYVLVMLGSILFNWAAGLALDRAQRKKPILVLSILVNLGVLGCFKYLGFLAEALNSLAGRGLVPVPQIALPVGISFFTFQAMSYVIDLYRGTCPVQRSLPDLALYISFFPQLIAGPIVRYHDIDRQIRSRTVTAEKFASGLRRFLYGLGKKVILANGTAQLADAIFDLGASTLSPGVCWLGAIAYTLQIYYDFSGYSDMAIGLGRIFGFEFLENFNYPYLSGSIQEFWQRWHISLGSWFREYVYIPLGGNRKGQVRTYVNLLIVFFLTGLWHGAGLTFILWGLYHGFFQILERLGLKKWLNRHSILSRIYCLLVVILGWVLFRGGSLRHAGGMLLHMLLPWRYSGLTSFGIFTAVTPRSFLILVCALLGCGPIPLLVKKWNVGEKYAWAELIYLALVFCACVMLLTAGSYNPFIYFRF